VPYSQDCGWATASSDIVMKRKILAPAENEILVIQIHCNTSEILNI
jgi:hypothetical protein